MTTAARKIFDDSVLPLFEERESQAKWIERARKVAVEIAAKRGWVTADDIHDKCPPPEGSDKRVMGAVFAGQGLVKDGYVNSIRKACHGRPCAVWRLPLKVQ
jgi:hypothetical protein